MNIRTTRRPIPSEVAIYFAAWVASLPPAAQTLAAEFPLGTSFAFELEGAPTVWYVIGYVATDHLVVTTVDPFVDYDAAHGVRIQVCAGHFRPTH